MQSVLQQGLLAVSSLTKRRPGQYCLIQSFWNQMLLDSALPCVSERFYGREILNFKIPSTTCLAILPPKPLGLSLELHFFVICLPFLSFESGFAMQSALQYYNATSWGVNFLSVTSVDPTVALDLTAPCRKNLGKFCLDNTSLSVSAAEAIIGIGCFFVIMLLTIPCVFLEWRRRSGRVSSILFHLMGTIPLGSRLKLSRSAFGSDATFRLLCWGLQVPCYDD